MKLLTIIVNYRTADLTIDALASLESQIKALTHAQVVVVDNASGDGSAERIEAAIVERRWGGWVTLVRAERNGGFAYGNNLGLRVAVERRSIPAYVHLLNPDTIVRPGAIQALISFMDAHPEVGIAGSRLEDPDGTPQMSAFRFPGILGELDRSIRFGPISKLLARWVELPPIWNEPQPTDWVAGASMIIRREVFDAVGPLDEGYFMYYEEVDFTLSARKAGWSCWYVPASRVVHLVGQASGVTDPKKARRRRPAYWFESRRRYMLKHFGVEGAVAADLATIAGQALWQVRRVVERKADDTPERFLRDSVRHSVFSTGFRL
jgi:GT2 family glycosyltransferase